MTDAPVAQSVNTPQIITQNIPDLDRDIVVKIACGYDVSYLLAGSGRLFCFGDGSQGGLGAGQFETTYLPTDIASHFPLEENENLTNIFAGEKRVYGLTTRNRLFMCCVSE